MDRKSLAAYPLIAAGVLVFGYFGIDKFLNPILWVGFLPSWMDGLLGMSKDTWILITGALEIFFALLLLIPVKRVRQAACILIALHLLAVLWQVGWNDIGVRDIGLLLGDVALFLLL